MNLLTENERQEKTNQNHDYNRVPAVPQKWNGVKPNEWIRFSSRKRFWKLFEKNQENISFYVFGPGILSVMLNEIGQSEIDVVNRPMFVEEFPADKLAPRKIQIWKEKQINKAIKTF